MKNQISEYNMKYIVFFVVAFFLVGALTIPQSFAQDAMPSWIKNNAGWWADDVITENEFLKGIEYLIKNDIIVISSITDSEKPEISIDFSYTKLVPDWIKNNAGWWADGIIPDSAFVSGIQWLISNDIMNIPPTEQGTGSDDVIPGWIKNNAGWWANGEIPDSAFVSGLQWLISNGIMNIS